MIDIKIIRETPEIIRENIRKKRSDFDVELLILKDKQWRESLQEMEKLKHERNKATKEIAESKSEGKIKEMQEIKEKIKETEEKTNSLENEVKNLLMKCPNMMHESVPEGKDASENPVIKEWGEKTEKTFEIKPHGEIAEELGVANFEKASEVTGRGFNYLIGDLAMLDQALQRFALDFLSEKGYTPVFPPFMLSRKAYEGAVDLSDFENVMYKIEDQDLYLIATSEHPLMAMFSNEVIPEDNLPIKLAGISACFRKEIGAHGVDTRGLFRMHQFNKIEQVIICRPEESYKHLEETQKNTEEMFQQLGIPHRVIEICSGDLSIKNSKQYDIEAWFPRGKEYREVTSASNCTDYQARRLNIKFGKHGGTKEYAHTLNNTGIATSRAMVAIIENFQNKDGTITVPEVLRKYMNGKEKITSRY